MAPIPTTVVITGASSGIGRALALRYAREGIVLGLLGRNAKRLNIVTDECRQRGATVSNETIDVCARSDMENWLRSFQASTPVDILIANAGLMAGRLANADLESAAASYAVIETNVLGVLNSVQPVLPQMMLRGKGQIGIVSSIAAFIPLPDAPSYSASKSAILNYGLALRAALRQSGIGVSVICPGYVATPMMEQELGPKPAAMSVQSAANIIVHGLQKNRPIIAFPFWFSLITRLGGLLPDSVRRWTVEPFRFSVGERNADG